MQMSFFLCSCVCIASLFSSVSAISVTFGSPTQCDPFSISWTGGQSPFTIQLTPFFQPFSTFPVPPSAFSDGQGSYSIPQLPLASGTTFLLTMFDSTGYSPAATTTAVLTVGPPVANNNCNMMGSQEFGFNTSGIPQQYSGYTFSTYGDAVTPLTIVGLIPGGNLVKIYPVTTSSYTWPVNVQSGTEIAFFILGSDGGQGGVSPLYTVQPSSDTSYLNANLLSLTMSNGTSTVGIIAGAAGGGVTLLIFLIILGIYCRRKSSRSSDITVSQKRETRRLRRRDEGREAIQNDQVMRNVASQSKDHISRSPEVQPGSQSQSRLSSASSIDPIRQHIRRQISYMESFPEDFAVNDPHATSSRPSRLSADIDATTEHGNTGRSSFPPTSRQIVEMARRAASQDYPYETYPVNRHAPPMQHESLSHHRSASSFAAGDHSYMGSDIPSFARHASAGSSSVSSAGRTMTSNNPFPHQTIPVSFAIPNQHGTLSHHPSASSFAFSDGASTLHHVQALRLSSDVDGFARNASAGSSSVSSASRQMAAMAGRPTPLGSSFPHQTATDTPFALPNQRGTLSHHPSANSFAFNDGISPLHQAQTSRLSSNIDDFAQHMGAGSSTMFLSGGQPSTASGPTITHSSAQIIRHTDMVDDGRAVTVTQEVIELPPEYTERPFLATEPTSGVVAEPPAPNQKPSCS